VPELAHPPLAEKENTMTDRDGLTQGLADTQDILRRITEELAAKFDGVFDPQLVERYVFESYTALARTAKIKTYLPSITRHFAMERLTALADSRDAGTGRRPEVLFVGVRNAGPSQLAAGLLQSHAAGRVGVRSAGSLPAERVDPHVVTALARLGIDMENEFPKPVTDDVLRAADVVITMGTSDTLPVYPGKSYEDWAVEDTVGKSLIEVQQIRDDLDARIRELLGRLDA
jgi:arsenate reductase (thioredoxin)